jgi:hypothetical protein
MTREWLGVAATCCRKGTALAISSGTRELIASAPASLPQRIQPVTARRSFPWQACRQGSAPRSKMRASLSLELHFRTGCCDSLFMGLSELLFFFIFPSFPLLMHMGG